MSDENLEREAAKILFSTPSKPEESAASTEPRGPEIAFVCPFCNEAYSVSEELAGKKINCRNCREASRVDGKKTPPRKPKGLPFWLGIVVGIGVGAGFSLLLVTALKLLRIL
jgi:hypothetical protein